MGWKAWTLVVMVYCAGFSTGAWLAAKSPAPAEPLWLRVAGSVAVVFLALFLPAAFAVVLRRHAESVRAVEKARAELRSIRASRTPRIERSSSTAAN